MSKIQDISDDYQLPELAADARETQNILAEEQQRKDYNALIKGRTLKYMPLNPFAPVQPKSDRRPVISSRERYKFTNGDKQRRARILNTRIRQVQQARSQRERGVPHMAEAVLSYILLHLGHAPDKGYEGIGGIIGCHADTVENIVHWLEKKGWLDYFHTRGRTASGKYVRQANCYVFLDPAEETIFKRILRAARPVYRDRPNRNAYGGDQTTRYIREFDPTAERRLAHARAVREAELAQIYPGVFKTST
jgi:hypothetical protein